MDRLHSASQTMMVQPYLGAVEECGETALLFFGGTYSHAIRKGRMLDPHVPPATAPILREDIRPRRPSAAERAVAADVLDALPWPTDELLYARVDLIPGADGRPRLIELELTEPSAFLSYEAGAARRLAEAVLARV